MNSGIGVDSVNKYKIFSKYDALDIHRKMEPQLLIGIDDKAISDVRFASFAALFCFLLTAVH